MLGTKLGTSGHNHEHRTKSVVEVGAPPKNQKLKIKRLKVKGKKANLPRYSGQGTLIEVSSGKSFSHTKCGQKP